MTHEQIKAVLDRVLTWPPERQEDAAEILASLEAQDGSPLRLTAEQAAEVRRRLADPSPDTIPADEVFERLRRLGNEDRFRSPGAARSRAAFRLDREGQP